MLSTKYLPVACLLVFFLFSCKDETHTSNPVSIAAVKDSVVAPVLQQPGKTWIENFRIFRDAVYHKEPAKARMFVDLAALNANEQIWYAIPDTTKGARQSDQVFTDQDFYKHFDDLFSKEFIDCLLKIKTEELYTKGEFDTIEFTNSDSLDYRIYSSFDKAENKLKLNLAYRGARAVGNGEFDPIEYNVVYVFHVLPTGVLLLSEIWVAG